MPLAGWNHSDAIVIQSSAFGMTADVTDIPYRISITPSRTDFWANVKSDGTDVRFTLADETTLLKFEIESFDYAGQDAHYHVKIPTLSYAADTVIYIQSGNAGASSGEDIANTWDSDFKAVYHLNQDKAAGAFDDSTVNALDLTNSGTTDTVFQIDKGREFTTGDYLSRAANALLSPGANTNHFTVEAWFQTSATGTDQAIFSSDGSGNQTFLVGVNGSINRVYLYLYMDSTNAYSAYPVAVVNDGLPHHVVAIKTGDKIQAYLDGILSQITDAGINTTLTVQSYHKIGRRAKTTTYPFIGKIDEVTVSKGAAPRSSDWVIARYNSGLGLGRWQHTGSGGFVIGGSAGIAKSVGITGGGGFVMGGSADVVAPIKHTGSGGFVAGGSPTIVQKKLVTGGGGFIIGGASLYESLHAGQRVFYPSGGFVMGGSNPATKQVGFLPSGGFIVGGSAIYIPSYSASLEYIYFKIKGSTGPITGGSALTSLKLIKEADQTIFDWGSNTFKDSGWILTAQQLTEVDASNLAGLYMGSVDMSLLDSGRFALLLEYTGTPYQAGELSFLVRGGVVVDWYISNSTDMAVSTRLAEASYTAPDNAGIAALPTLSEIEGSGVLAKQAKLDFVEKWILNKLVESTDGTSVTLYDDDGTTPLKVWPYTSATKTRSKAT